MSESHFDARLPAWPIAAARVATGILFLIAVRGKLAAGAEWPDRMVAFLSAMEGKSAGFYWPFIENTVIPHNALFGYAVAYGELALAVALITGTCTRLASFFGVIMVANFMLAKGAPFWTPTNHDSLYIVLLAVFMLTGAGRSFGVDHYLARRFPRPLLW